MPDTEIGVGDLVIVSSGNPNGGELQAVVTEKTGFSVTIAYNSEPPAYVFTAGLRLDLFANDITFQRMLAALAALRDGDVLTELLLLRNKPGFTDAGRLASSFQQSLNISQKRAVEQSLLAEDLFLVHGPPGTGKTTTMAESILQHVRLGVRVLATADSNTAVDNLVQKLDALGCSVLRIGNPARLDPRLANLSLDYILSEDPAYQETGILRAGISELKEKQYMTVKPTGQNRRGLTDDAILKAAKKGASARGISHDKVRRMASWIKLQHKINALNAEAKAIEDKAVRNCISAAEVVCSTNSAAGSTLLEPFSFDVCFVDEATQSVEPSCLIPMVKARKWILAGDHRQLPPTVLSKEADDLHHSLFERWMQSYGGAPSALLTIQYRMHAAIMAFSNDAFYGGQLMASPTVAGHHMGQLTGFAPPVHADHEPDRSILDPELPVVFLNVAAGMEQRIQGSFSYFNRKEAQVVEKTVHTLLGARLFPEDVGVISPYDQQVNHLSQLLAGLGLEVKTIDGFQGREKEVVVISLVRANDEGNLGFLTDYRRLNVALTRARRKLILIGHKDTLVRDGLYATLIAQTSVVDIAS
jgi:predicted DNA helicase